ncbi:MAG: EVE domain-containing protein [Ilumatobacter sp.]|nr:EVE domain-containing protein [Ilumatobacter sp.]
MFHDTDEVPEPTNRLRRRHLVAAVAERVELDEAAAGTLMDVIEGVIDRNAAQHERFAVLPRAGTVAARPGGFVGDAQLTARDTHEPLIAFSAEIADTASLTIDQVELAVAIITKMVESAPDEAAVYVPGWGYHGDDVALERVWRQDQQELVDEYRKHPTTTWVLQCNPAKWDVFGFIDETGELPTSWSISRNLDQIAEGDRVVFWLSGRDAGVYAIGDVLEAPRLGHVDSDHLGDDADHVWEWFVPIALDLDLFDTPVLRSDLKHDPRFADEPIIRVPWAANPHPLSTEAFGAILDRIDEPTG